MKIKIASVDDLNQLIITSGITIRALVEENKALLQENRSYKEKAASDARFNKAQSIARMATDRGVVGADERYIERIAANPAIDLDQLEQTYSTGLLDHEPGLLKVAAESGSSRASAEDELRRIAEDLGLT